jgi:hypothetical protein
MGFSEETENISLNSINQLVFAMQKKCIFCVAESSIFGSKLGELQASDYLDVPNTFHRMV